MVLEMKKFNNYLTLSKDDFCKPIVEEVEEDDDNPEFDYK